MKTVDPLHGISAFLAVADHSSFTRAAEALGLTRATVSAQVAELEERLGARLFHRTTRAVRLTPSGEAYREGLADMRARVAAAERAARAQHSEPEGRLRVTAPPDLGQRFLIPWVHEFLETHPGIRMELELSNSARHLIEEQFDLALRGTLAIEENLVTRQIGQSRLHTCASPDYLAAHGMPAAPEGLAGHRILHFSPIRRGRRWRFERGGEQREVPVEPRLELSDGWALRLAALEGAGICQLPGFSVGGDLRSGRLVEILPDWRAGQIPLHAVYPDNRRIAQRVRAFTSFLARKAKAEPDLQEG
ncbi:LysR family transcriptional regulator [Mangrovicoccus sp. HB161399]|uniref:LysR family transcriptional regulator n=1 Tax=Mangrovicoccus sp. HB161399 TaxID=2720392 RepID=UPI001554274F|nr:LysR family transcriptional regulator [Mangrovicoccus sp. HB161399]